MQELALVVSVLPQSTFHTGWQHQCPVSVTSSGLTIGTSSPYPAGAFSPGLGQETRVGWWQMRSLSKEG